MLEDNAWIGVDLDGTAAVYDGWKGIEHIGAPIESVINQIKFYLACGIKVRWFTARCQEGPKAIEYVVQWSLNNLGVALPVTDRKDFDMVAMIDDRACAVEKNTGKFLTKPPLVEHLRFHNSLDNPDNPAYTGGNK